ncbi:MULTISPECIES: hybrid sensor histidine kinase/response regulator [Caballeronia]|jgi:signal transduction histidine kinase/CheY-like chemotaxis protein|uniref:hybrid sensor histidine kinase/response regulator n=1 Tax=Caballeronia TaxID=1827195 RepID=UPI00025BCBC4|nr:MULTISPECIES: hybrid sensor histidine kinase/response regulator [Caballeronia]EKS71004.1 periplasmic sensor hybrid histidine kinase [Burkholderia sp. SJ98]MDR5788910.1 ATP-binding protein [Caballeronia sp. LP003]
MIAHQETSVPDSTALDIPVPPRDFGVTRRMLLAVLAASIITPLLFLATYGYFGFQTRIADSTEGIDRLSRVAEEQAVKVLDVNQEVSLRIMAFLGDDGDVPLRARQQSVHRFLRQTAERVPSVFSIAVFGRKGNLLASSSTYPVGLQSIGDRSDIWSARHAASAAVGMLRPEQISDPARDVFDVTFPRYDSSGQYLGVLAISLRRDYFSSFYDRLTAHDRALTVGLFRSDGTTLVRFPEPKARRAPTSSQPLLEAIQANRQSGRLKGFSTLDGVEKLLVYREVGSYPLYVTSGIPVSTVTYRWLRHDGLIAIATLVPCVGIWFLVVFSLSRLKRERTAWDRWKAEFGMRVSAEATSRQMKRMGALGNLVANVAHDFNNLLMVVKANMELARRKHFNGLEKEVIAVERASASAEVLARRLLSVARKQPLREEFVDVKDWLEREASLIQMSLNERIRFHIRSSDEIWPIYVDQTELQSALINLAVNARDAMPGGGDFTIRTRNITLDTSKGSLKPGDYVVIACSDTGVGMPASVMQRAFEPLFTTKAANAGTGLGLAQVIAMCEQARGTARIESEEGKGTTVSLILPRGSGQAEAKAKATTVSPSPPVTVTEATKGSILLVEDNEEVAAGLSAVLEVFGWQSRHELTGDAALGLLEDGAKFDLILSDIQMPGLNNGIDVAEKVRRKWPKQAIALMTGYADEFERAKNAGVTILSKPFNIDDLQALLQSVAPAIR